MDPVIEGTSAAGHTESGERTQIEGTSAAEHTVPFGVKSAYDIQFSLQTEPVIKGTSATEHTEIEETSAAAEHTESGERTLISAQLSHLEKIKRTLISAQLSHLEKIKRTQWPANSIFRAPAHIRPGRESNFEPKLVSIGPYYHGRENLKHMEDLKLQCIRECMNLGIDDVPVEDFMNLEGKARDYYKQEFDYSPHNFVRMLVLDSCFIIRTILSLSEDLPESMAFLDVPIKEVRSDLLLLENQIPLFFIEKVYEWNHRYAPFIVVLKPFICLDMPWRINNEGMSSEAAHLLDLYWRCSSPREMNYMQSSEHSELTGFADNFFSQSSEQESHHSQQKSHHSEQESHHSEQKSHHSEQESHHSEQKSHHSQQESHHSQQKSHHSQQNRHHSQQNEPSTVTIFKSNNAPMLKANASELHKMAGIKFEKFQDRGYLDVIFSNGIMRMPCLKIDTRQTTLLVNVIAFENCKLPSMRTFSCYMKLMDALIDSEEDVKLLQKCGVIYNTLSSHEMAATFFNDIGNFCFIDYDANFYRLYKDVQKYYNSSWHRRWANLQQNYFSSPWAGISVIAGVTLLILSALQTFYTIYGYYKPHN